MPDTPKLQPLRVPAGWSFTYNQWYEIDPSPEAMEYFSNSIMFGMVTNDGRWFIDLTFYPDDVSNGQFHIELCECKNPKVRKSRRIWEPLLNTKCPDRLTAVAFVERALSDVYIHGAFSTTVSDAPAKPSC